MRFDLHPDFGLRFEYIAFPLWRKYALPVFRPLVNAFLGRFYPVVQDRIPPSDTTQMARYLVRWGLLNITQISRLEHAAPQFIPRSRETPRTHDGKIRLPAPWEQLQAVIVSFPIKYPPLWALYAQMIEAITPVAEVQLTIPSRIWASGIWHYLAQRGKADLKRVYFLDLPTDDIWVRDYGAFVGAQGGQRAVISATFNTEPKYPQAQDNAMPQHFAAWHDLPYREIPLQTEGGNFLTDGAGTLIMTSAVLQHNPQHTPQSLEALLHEYFEFDKLILTPRLRIETTGHVDMLLKLIDPQTVLLSAPNTPTTRARLQAAKALFEQETNAQGQRYRVETVPTLPFYANWFFYPIRRSYTNALTVNGRILVPIYQESADADVLATYRRLAPTYEIIPIDCKIGANGGGAVHCMTKELPV